VSKYPAGDGGTLDHDLSRRVAERGRAEPKECYRNAVLALMVDPEGLLPAGTRYVEGYALYHDTGLPVEHGWLAYDGPDGEARVVDPTAIVVAGAAAEVSYFPAHSWTRAELKKGATWAKALPLWHAAHGWGDPAMREASNRVWRALGVDMEALRRGKKGEGAGE
jgi:hypothetical protein